VVVVAGNHHLMANEVRHNPERSRYELVVHGHVVGIADYVDDGDVVVFPHTVIDADKRGRGLGAELVRGALDDVVAAGRTVVPTCWFVAEFIDDHPEYQRCLRTA
jgi:uncharacterized protein